MTNIMGLTKNLVKSFVLLEMQIDKRFFQLIRISFFPIHFLHHHELHVLVIERTSNTFFWIQETIFRFFFLLKDIEGKKSILFREIQKISAI